MRGSDPMGSNEKAAMNRSARAYANLLKALSLILSPLGPTARFDRRIADPPEVGVDHENCRSEAASN